MIERFQFSPTLPAIPRVLVTIALLGSGVFLADIVPASAQVGSDRESAVGVGTGAEMPSDTSPESSSSSSPSRGSRLAGILNGLRARFERQEQRLGSRAGLCPYTPGLLGDTDSIYSDIPVFLWQGSATHIAVFNYDSFELVWEASLDDEQSSVVYGGSTPLEHGQKYYWQLTHPELSLFPKTFAILPAEERAEIDLELEQQESALATASTSERAVIRAEVFGDRNLWSDVLQELHSLRADNREIATFAAELEAHISSTPNDATTESARAVPGS